MKYYIIAGEASGDLHGSNLIKELVLKDSKATIRAWGGDLMQQAGAEMVKHYRDLAFMGFLEVVQNLGTILQNIRFCQSDIEAFSPDILILIDYPGFNMRIASWAKKRGIQVHYYIMPQVWAWKENRINKLKRDTDYQYAILPFELDFFNQKHQLNVSFVGHPLLDALGAYHPNKHFKKNHLPKNAKPIVALLPGSRKQEIQKLLPIMSEVAQYLSTYQFVIAGTAHQPIELYHTYAPDLPIVFGNTYNLLSVSKAALVTSGTATLETALLKVPQIVCYKTSLISYAIAKRVVNLPFISLVNLIMEREVVQEFIQDECNKHKLIKFLPKIIDGNQRNKILRDYEALAQKLGGIGASKTVATKIINNATSH